MRALREGSDASGQQENQTDTHSISREQSKQVLSKEVRAKADQEEAKKRKQKLVEKKRNKKKTQETDENKEEKEDRFVRKIVLAVVGALIVIVGIAGFTFYSYVHASLQPKNIDDDQYVTVNIPNGSTNRNIGDILEQEGVIRSGAVFNYYSKFHNLSNFQSGYYNFQPSMTLEEITQMLQSGGSAEPQMPALGKILIPEGYGIEQIAQAITRNAANKKGEKSPFSSEEFMALMKDDDFFNEMKERYPQLLEGAAKAQGVRYRLEGYLFPATYDYIDTTTVRELVETMIRTMNERLTPYYEQIKEKGMSVHEVLSLAAYVEKEGAKEDDRRNIAQVFFNRLKADMPLQTNISVLYAEGRSGQQITAEEDKHINTKIDSPFNLYVHTGFGPGPVASPSLMSIQAVLDPIENDYLYFIANPKTGEVYFSKTYEEHMTLVEKYLN